MDDILTMPKTETNDEWIPDDPAVELWFKLIRVRYLMIRRGAQLYQQHDVTPLQFIVMRRLYEGENLTQQKLADRLFVTKGNISQMLKVMERKGLIDRIKEGSSKRLVITDKARAILKEFIPAHTQFVDSQLSSLSPAEQTQFLDLLEKLEDVLVS